MYPLKFDAVYQKRLWGGGRLRELLHKPIPAELHREPVGESWELADLPSGTVKADSAGANPNGSLSSLITNGPLAGKRSATPSAIPPSPRRSPAIFPCSLNSSMPTRTSPFRSTPTKPIAMPIPALT